MDVSYKSEQDIEFTVSLKITLSAIYYTIHRQTNCTKVPPPLTALQGMFLALENHTQPLIWVEPDHDTNDAASGDASS